MDTELVTRAQGGDQEAFADLVYTVANRFLAVSHRILGDISLAEDATQQAQLSIWQCLIMAWQTKYYAGTPAEVVAELEAIVQSATFGE
jgi:DNA-directed RNA polymerase specialized sigma24 family protein